MTIADLYAAELVSHERETIHRVSRLDLLKALIDAGIGDTDIPERVDETDVAEDVDTYRTGVVSDSPWPFQPARRRMPI